MSLIASVFGPRQVTKGHITQLVVTLGVLGITGYRISMDTGYPITRGQIMPLTMGSTSLVFIAYQLLTRYVAVFQRYGKLSVYMIMNIIEPVLWAVAVGLMISSTQRFCIGNACTITWVTIGMCIAILITSIQPAIASTLEYQRSKRVGKGLDEETAVEAK